MAEAQHLLRGPPARCQGRPSPSQGPSRAVCHLFLQYLNSIFTSYLLLVGLFVTSCGSELRNDPIVVGVLEPDYPLAQKLVDLWPKETARDTFLIKLAYLNGDTGYDQLQEAYSNLQTAKADVVLGSNDEFYQMAAVKLGVPYVLTALLENEVFGTAFYMMPKPTYLCQAIEDVMAVRGWRQVSVIYEQTLDTAILNRLVGKIDLDLKFGQLSTLATPSDVKKLLLKFRRRKITEFLVLTRTSMVKTILQQARALGIVAVPQSWLLLNLGSQDMSSGILDELHTNITTINFVEETAIKNTLPGMDTLHQAMVDDALVAISRTRHIAATPDTLSEKLKKVSFEGNTGKVIFNNEGWRTNLSLSIYSRQLGKPQKEWRYFANRLIKTSGQNITDLNITLQGLHTIFPLKGRTVRVVTIMERPFCMYKKPEGNESLVGNDRYYGFTVDMMDKVSARMDFEYELHPVGDGKFGVELPDGSWNGIIGEILENKADMSFAPLSINAARERAVDFTKPFKTRGIAVLMKTPESQSSYFQFMKPLSGEVWVCTLVTMCLVTLILFAYEKHSLACRRDMPKLNLRESLWFIFGSLVQGSTESAPVTVPGRIITSAWWFFSLILISTYTANLAAFLTVKKIHPPISSITDLADQSKIAFGTVSNSGVEMFFKNTKVEPFAKMWTQMSEIFPDAMVNSTEAGLKKVKEGNYAFLWDSTVTSYVAARNCGYTEIGPTFDHKGFGIGVPTGSIYLEQLSMAILGLGDEGKIAQMEYKYWGETQCDDFSDPSTDETSELMLESAAGMFFVLIGGVVLGAIALAFERLLRRLRIIKPKNTFAPTEDKPRSGNQHRGPPPVRLVQVMPISQTNDVKSTDPK